MINKKSFKQGERMSSQEEALLQNEAKKAVAKLLGVKPRKVSTDVDSYDTGTPFAVWACNGRFGHFENGTVFDTTDMKRS